MNVSKSQLKRITGLSQKKYRQKHQLFIAEGVKVVRELLNASFSIETLFCTDNTLFDNTYADKTIYISEIDLKKISNLKAPNKVLGIFKIPSENSIKEQGLILVLDDINDPGNLGTIIRLCDWYGISQLICSKKTVDCYNPKVVQASMGSLTRVAIKYMDLELYLKDRKLPIFITDTTGENIYKTTLPKEGIIIMGNEANGVSDTLKNMTKNKITIPRFGKTQKIESLNVATATAILLSEFKRRF